MNVFPCGTTVYVRNIGVECLITAIEIRYELVRYECTYYCDSVQQRILVHATELMEDKPKVRLGFNHKNK